MGIGKDKADMGWWIELNGKMLKVKNTWKIYIFLVMWCMACCVMGMLRSGDEAAALVKIKFFGKLKKSIWIFGFYV
ncbi:hypothetical protein HanRHA438_Chr03g0100731 [Helianthus annuus]|uniref:Uncharacterized protein n=1 Tax=Helianthus annuus TaxID=4232 RepID=A0A9K3JD00_HELAN|nr:hypothetical protein HanXRQr2_Chr03g0089401 [Helianthus annuus]KAJ0495872.1 hypothetical protein HanIR_Chr12g0613781 [Helianthus annuus]KAJ0591619.1 hypothetical protein HanHA300_Chr03g0075321 [Helianthus annuus]KAJ0606513.1 hypothetical protein HanHA89_Chr03g0085971 [Helianthus annuus]KAJ0772505.1 hypothetical protein HanOQP8_Chr03g0088091 [Helianthus annuus]